MFLVENLFKELICDYGRKEFSNVRHSFSLLEMRSGVLLLHVTFLILNSIYIFMFSDSILEVLAVPSKGKDKCWEYTQCMQQLTILLGILMP